MKRNIVSTTLVIVCATVLSLAATARTGDAACSLSGAAGTYGFQDNGTVYLSTGATPRTATGIFTLDGQGNLTGGKATQSLGGDVSPETFTGTYKISPDCTGSFAIGIIAPTSAAGNLTVNGEFVWDDNMNQIRFIFETVTLGVPPTQPPQDVQTAINGEGRKLVTQNGQ